MGYCCVACEVNISLEPFLMREFLCKYFISHKMSSGSAGSLHHIVSSCKQAV